MFGYVKIFKPSIRMGEYEIYKGIYCTLCKRLDKRYGLLSRFTLSYDMTFLALLQMALAEEDADFCPSRCSFNPSKRCLKVTTTAAIDRAADIGTILTYYKLKDTLADEGLGKKIGAWCALPFAAAAHKKAKKRVPAIDDAVAAMMTAQSDIEAEDNTSQKLLEAVREGKFYATQGPEIHLQRTDAGVCVKCSPCREIIFHTARAWAPGRVLEGDGLTEACFAVKEEDHFVRAEVVDADGKRAWSNIILL